MKKYLLTLLGMICSVVALAQTTYTLSLNGSATQSTAGWFTVVDGGGYNTKYTGIYNGTSYSSGGLKLNSKSSVSFTTTASSTVTIVQSLSSNSTNTMKFDNSELATSTRVDYTDESNTTMYNVGIFTISDVAAGDHSIIYSSETGILFVQVDEAATTAPSLIFSSTSASLDVTPAITTQTTTFTITGKNLTDGTYDLTVPSVDGLTVSPTSVTVADGSLSQEVTVTYAPTADADAATAEISLTIGDITATNTISYSAKITAYEQTIISTETTWDFAECGYSGDYIPSENITEPTLYANLGIGIGTEGFDGTSLAWQGTTSQYAIRNGNSANNGTLSFKTSVDGKINVNISDTGNSGTQTNRYLVVNGIQTVFYTVRDGSSKGQLTTGDVYVRAGDVTITGSGGMYVYEITFTPADNETKDLDVNGYTTLTSDYAFTVSGATAYTASVDGETVTLTAVDGAIPAGTGVVLVGDANGTATIVPATSDDTAAEISSNALVGVSSVTTALNEGTNYVLANDGVDTKFVQAGSATYSDLIGKAYINVADASEAKSLNISFGEATGISEVAVEAEATNNAMYNLAGQRVNAAAKGIVIMNGKKYVNR